jgi:hypothetical protein
MLFVKYKLQGNVLRRANSQHLLSLPQIHQLPSFEKTQNAERGDR